MYSLLSVRLGKMKDLFCSPVKGVLIDISGVLKDGNKAIPGSIEAFKRLVWCWTILFNIIKAKIEEYLN